MLLQHVSCYFLPDSLDFPLRTAVPLKALRMDLCAALGNARDILFEAPLAT